MKNFNSKIPFQKLSTWRPAGYRTDQVVLQKWPQYAITIFVIFLFSPSFPGLPIDAIAIMNDTSMGMEDNSTDILDCPIYKEGDDLQIAKFSFWLEGVTQCCVAVCGLIGNFISAFILTRYKSLGFILNYFTESDVKVFDVDTNSKGYSAFNKMLTTSFMN